MHVQVHKPRPPSLAAAVPTAAQLEKARNEPETVQLSLVLVSSAGPPEGWGAACRPPVAGIAHRGGPLAVRIQTRDEEPEEESNQAESLGRGH